MNSINENEGVFSGGPKNLDHILSVAIDAARVAQETDTNQVVKDRLAGIIRGLRKLGAEQLQKETKMKLTKDTLKQIIAEEIENILSEEGAERTAKGNITQDTREKYATVGKDKFPIFDKKSAEAAIDLRGHAPEKDRARIINKAAKYAPEAAKKAREADKAE